MTEKEAALQKQVDTLVETINGLESTSKMLIRRDIDLRKAYDNLKTLDREKTEFVSIAAHQLRTPVTTARWAMQGLLQNLSDTTENNRKLLNQAAESIERIFSLTEDLLELNRIDYGDTTICPVLGSLEKMIESICTDHQPLIRKRVITLDKNYATTAKPVPFDPARMRDALDNLIDNAIKYTPINGKISITTTYTDTHAEVTIADTGIGVETGLEEKIFQKFTRLGNAEAVDPNGIGLGLYVAKNFIEKHHGSLTYTHNKPTGSVFTIKIPC